MMSVAPITVRASEGESGALIGHLPRLEKYLSPNIAIKVSGPSIS